MQNEGRGKATTELSFLPNCTFCAQAGYVGVYKKCSLVKMNQRYSGRKCDGVDGKSVGARPLIADGRSVRVGYTR